jgi:hypothetical protein
MHVWVNGVTVEVFSDALGQLIRGPASCGSTPQRRSTLHPVAWIRVQCYDHNFGFVFTN